MYQKHRLKSMYNNEKTNCVNNDVYIITKKGYSRSKTRKKQSYIHKTQHTLKRWRVKEEVEAEG